MSFANAGSGRAMLAVAALAGMAFLAFGLIVLDLSPEIVLAVVVAGIAIPILVLRPHLGVQIFIATIFIENIVYASQNATAIKAVGALILVGWFLNVAVNRKLNLRLGPVVLFAMTFVVWNAFCIMYAYDTAPAVVAVMSYMQLAIAMCMVGSVIDSVDKVRGVMRAIVLWSTAAAVHGMALYFLGLRGTSAGVVVNRNTMAIFLNIAIACAYILYQMSPSAGERLWLLISLPTLFLGLALTFSRAGFLTLVAIFALLGYRLAKGRGHILLGATAGMLIVMSTFLPEEFYKRVASIAPSLAHQEDTFGTRVDLWKAGLEMLQDHPIVGVGPGNFAILLPRYGQGMMLRRTELVSHNTFVGIAAEGGIPALILFLLLCGAALREASLAVRDLKQPSEFVSLQALAVELCVVVVLLMGLSNNSERQKYLYIFFGLALSLRQIALKAGARERSREDSTPGIEGAAEALEPMRTG